MANSPVPVSHSCLRGMNTWDYDGHDHKLAGMRVGNPQRLKIRFFECYDWTSALVTRFV